MKNSVKWHVIIFITQCVILVMLVAMLCAISYTVEMLTHGEPVSESTETATANSMTFDESDPASVIVLEEAPYFKLSDFERHVVESIVMGESGNQPYEGQVAVAECILNACELENLQPSEVRVKYQYAGWNESPSESVANAVSQVFDDGNKMFDENILWFYNPNVCSSSFHESQTLVAVIGDHRFFAPVV